MSYNIINYNIIDYNIMNCIIMSYNMNYNIMSYNMNDNIMNNEALTAVTGPFFGQVCVTLCFGRTIPSKNAKKIIK